MLLLDDGIFCLVVFNLVLLTCMAQSIRQPGLLVSALAINAWATTDVAAVISDLFFEGGERT